MTLDCGRVCVYDKHSPPLRLGALPPVLFLAVFFMRLALPGISPAPDGRPPPGFAMVFAMTCQLDNNSRSTATNEWEDIGYPGGEG